MHLLRGVDEEKEEREGARRHRREIEWRGSDVIEQRVERSGTGIAATPRTASAAQTIDGLKSLFPFEPLNDAPEGGGQPPDVVVEGNVFRASVRRPGSG